jgi:hypothetical protein
MLKVKPGATIVGKSGKSLVVDRVEGNLIHCGDRTINILAVVEVLPRSFSIGDRVKTKAADIFIVDLIEDGIVCGWTLDGSAYIGGSPELLQHATTQLN